MLYEVLETIPSKVRGADGKTVVLARGLTMEEVRQELLAIRMERAEDGPIGSIGKNGSLSQLWFRGEGSDTGSRIRTRS